MRQFLKIYLFALLALTVATFPAARAETAFQQQTEGNTDRPGSDYKTLDLAPLTQPSLITLQYICSNDCFGDTKCKAWTLVRAGVQGPEAKCWLKTSIPAARPCDYCISGVVERNFEPGVDRPGLDYKNFDLSSADPGLCSAQCTADTKCQAWTYVNAGVQGPHPRCWMKTPAPAADINSCCTSGVPSRPVVVR